MGDIIYNPRRAQFKDKCRDEIFYGSMKGALAGFTVGGLSFLALNQFWPYWKNKVSVTGKSLYIVAWTVCSTYVAAEQSEISCVRKAASEDSAYYKQQRRENKEKALLKAQKKKEASSESNGSSSSDK